MQFVPKIWFFAGNLPNLLAKSDRLAQLYQLGTMLGRRVIAERLQ